MSDPSTQTTPAARDNGPEVARLLERVPAVRYAADAAACRLLVVAGDVDGLIGRSADEAMALDHPVDVIHPDDRDVMLASVAAITPAGLPQTARYRLIHRDGSHRWVQDRRQAVVLDRRIVIVGVLTDITAHRAADMAELAERERDAHSERSVALTRLAGGIAHQFNNLLTAITGYTALAHETLAADDPAREFLDEALAASARAREVAASLLAFAGGVVLRPKECDINAIAAAAIARAWQPTARQGISVSFSPAPLMVHADPARLEDVITSLLAAVRGLEPGAPLSVTTSAADGAAVVELVEPTGRLGDDPGTLVTPFRRPPERVAVDDLAFAAADGIARGSGGRFEVEGRAFGTVVRLLVPLSGQPALATDTRDAAAAFAEASGAIGASVTGGLQAPRPARKSSRRVVLVVDDDEGVRTFMRALVARSGFVPVTAGTAGEALEILAGPSRVDALVADVVMPGIDGLTLAGLATDIRPDLAILFVSGDPGRHLPRDFGGRPFLPKPFGPAAFRDALRALFAEAPEG